MVCTCSCPIKGCLAHPTLTCSHFTWLFVANKAQLSVSAASFHIHSHQTKSLFSYFDCSHRFNSIVSLLTDAFTNVLTFTGLVQQVLPTTIITHTQ